MSAPYSAGNGCVIQHTSLGDRNRDRNWVEEKLSDMQARHDELLRTSRIMDRRDAREIRTLVLELQFTASTVWPETPDTIPQLRPLTCTIRTLDQHLWAAVPDEAA